jgi:predicted transcriptional regulator
MAVRMFNVRIDDELRARIQHAAVCRKQTISEWTRDALDGVSRRHAALERTVSDRKLAKALRGQDGAA